MFRNWTKSDIIFYGASMVLIITAGIIFEAAFISLVISIVGITAGIMNMKADKYCYLFYIVQITLYAFVSWRNRFIGEAILAAFYLLPLYIYSSVRWLGKKSVKTDFQIFRITKKLIVILAIACVVVTAGYGYILSLLKSNLPYINALGTFTSVAAGFLTSRRIKEQWYFWIAYSLIFSAIWISTLSADTTQITLVLQNIPYLAINIVGLIKWNKLYKEDEKNKALT